MAARRRFRLLLRLLPFDVREAHGRDMEQVFQACYADRRGGVRGTLTFWLAVLIDILRVAPRQHAEAVRQDLRYALRTLAASPSFAMTAILTIGIGVGAAAAMFAIVHAVLLRQLPFRDPGSIAIVWAVDPQGQRTWLSVPELEDLRERVPAFASLAGLADLRLVLTGAGDPEEVSAAAVSGSFADVLGISAQAGRLLHPSDDVTGAPPVAVLSNRLWRQQFGGRPEIVGSTIVLDGRSYTVAGVMPADFALPPPSSVWPLHVDVWVALASHATVGRDIRVLHTLGRLRGTAALADAREQARRAGAAVSAAFPEYRGAPWGFDVQPLHEDLSRRSRPALLVLVGMVTLVAVIAAANVAALLLSRGAARQRELAVRVALGATPARLLRQIITESLLLGTLGAIVGIALAAAVSAVVKRPPLAAIPRLADTRVDAQVLLFAAGVAILVTLAAGAAQLILLRRGAAGDALRVRDRSARAIRAGRVLATGEIALACAVLMSALALAQGLAALLQTDPGVRTGNILTFRLSLPPKYATPDRITSFFDAAVERLAALPGVTSAGGITQLPFSGASLGSTFVLEDRSPAGEARRIDADLRGVTPGYFSAVDLEILAGRGLQPSDRAAAPPVAVVDETFAQRAWPGENPIGKRIRWFRAPDRDLEVVGVARPVRHRGFEAPARETVYRPHAQYARTTMFIIVRTSGDPMGIAAAARDAVREIDPEQPIAELATLDALARRSLAQPAFAAAFSGVLAATAIGLVAVGVYGLFAFAVEKRRREIGIRLALGATPSRIIALILRDGLTLAACGLLVGVVLSTLAGRITAAVVPLNVSPGGTIMALAVAVITIVTALACLLPTRRAARVPPSVALRAE